MTTEEIKSRLKEKKMSERRLARRFRIGKTTAHFLINRTMVSERLDRRLAKLIGVTFEELRGVPEQKKAVGQ